MKNQQQIVIPAFAPPPPPSSKENEELKRLRSCSPLYKEFYPHWDLYLSAYEGGPEFANSKNLFKHIRENEEDYKDRCDRIHNMNYCESLVDFFTNFIFAEVINRDGGKNGDWYRKFIEDVNKKGESIDAVMRQISDDSQIFGMSYILVDAPPLPTDPGTIVTKQNELDLGIRPYWVVMKPDEITDWVVDQFGAVQYAKRKQCMCDIACGMKRELEEYTEFYPDHTDITVVDVTDPSKPVLGPKQPFPNPMGLVPIVVARFKRSKRHPFMGLSFLRDFAGNQREIMNLTSLLQEFLYRQCFNMLAMETDTLVPLKEQEDGAVGTGNVLQFPKGGEAPKYISPPADPAKFLQDERQRIKNEMFLRASQDAINELFNGEKSSGFSQAQSFSKTVPFISSRADMLEAVENQLMSLTLKMIGKEWDGKVKYKDRYEMTNLTDALTQFQILARDLQITSEKFIKTELKRFVHEFDGKLPVDVQAEIDKQIDAINFTEWVELQKTALVGKGSSEGNSPGEQQKPKDTKTMAEHAKESMKRSPAATNKVKT
jgi:hypothetical protein